MAGNEYIQRINQAIDYIQGNLDRSLTAEELADHCCFSRFYFGRMFKAVTGENVYAFIKRRKLENAAFLLKTRVGLPITEIACMSGYSPSNFASAFREHFGVSATEFRNGREYSKKVSNFPIVEHILELKKRDDRYDIVNSRITIHRISKMDLLYDRFIGNYNDLAGFWERFCKMAENRRLISERTNFIGISYDDPFITDENRCIYDVCINVDNFPGPNIHKIEEGYYACYRFSDFLTNLGKAYNEIFLFWMPFCGYKLENRFPLEIYRTGVDQDGRATLDICIPVDF